MMKIGFFTAPYRDQNFDDLDRTLGKLKGMGYDCIELCTCQGHVCSPYTLLPSRFGRVKELLENHELEICALGAHSQWVWGDIAKIVENRRFIGGNYALAKQLKCPVVNVTMGPFPGEEWYKRDKAWELLLHSFVLAAADAKKSKINLAVEAQAGHAVSTPEHVLEVIEKTESPFLKVNFDASHWQSTGQDWKLALEKMKDHIAHVHVRDYISDGKPLGSDGSNLARVKTVPIGQGHADIQGQIEMLRGIGYEGAVSVDLDVDGDALDEAAQASVEYLRKLVGEPSPQASEQTVPTSGNQG